MLIQFMVRNYKLFKNEALLDCIPAPISEHRTSLLCDPADKAVFLPVISLYGPNGCGKSSILEGLFSLCRFVTGDSSLISHSSRLYYRLAPECKEQPVSFDVLFRSEGFLFRYQLSLLNGVIEEENLFYGGLENDDAGIIFSRKEKELHLGRAAGELTLEGISLSAPLLPCLEKRSGSPYIKAAVTWFRQVSFQPVPEAADIPVLPQLDNERGAICRLLQDMDVDIRDYSYQSQADRVSRLFLVHGKPGFSPTSISYTEESQGIKKLLRLLPAVQNSLEQGSLLLVDDLDYALHPSLLHFLIRLYKSREKNPHNAQLLFTGHNTAILTPTLLRRDEICLCCRPAGREAVLYPLSSYKKENGLIPRNDEAYGKQYLEGRYGAVPQNGSL